MSKMLDTNDSHPTLNDASLEDRLKAQKELVEKLKVQWQLLWSERFNDKVKSEGVSIKDYAPLGVERGTVIHATRDFKALNFKEILELNMVENIDRVVQPDPQLGGWNKFVKMNITNRIAPRSKPTLPLDVKKHVGQHPKKGGRGWLHAK